MTTAEILAALVAAAPPGTDPLNAECGTELTVGGLRATVGPVITIGNPDRDGCITLRRRSAVALVWTCGDAKIIPGDWSAAFVRLLKEVLP